MYSCTFGGKKGQKVKFKISENRVVVRTRNARSLENAVHSPQGKKVLEKFSVELNLPDADVCVLHTKQRSVRSRGAAKPSTKLRDQARSVLKKEPELRFAGRVLAESDADSPVLYTENIFIKFFNKTSASKCEKIMEECGFKIKRKVAYAKNAYFVGCPDGTGLKVFKLAEDLLKKKPEVQYCHPELIKHSPRKAVINEKQWHLQTTTVQGQRIMASANVAQAHKMAKGAGVTVAVIDDGFDIDHPEFNVPGKVIASRDATLSINDPRPKYWNENHGTACAGVAVAAGINASGVAPEAKLMPIRLASVLGSMAEADAFYWAADKGADIISCSWGPLDGAWYQPNDPAHRQQNPIPDSTRLAVEYAAKHGRNGKGCVICWASGNGRESVMNDGYASNQDVITVGACNDTNTLSVYSDFGEAVWLVFPSGDFAYQPFSQPPPLTNGIYTTDRMSGMGYKTTDYTDNFTGTSAATPGVAGVVALMLSVNPNLTAPQVKKLLAESCAKIDIENGKYDSRGKSPYYGFGRIDAEVAVKRAKAIKRSATTKTDKPTKIKVQTGKPKVKTKVKTKPTTKPKTKPVIATKPTPEKVALTLTSALVNPKGWDRGKETVTIKNPTKKAIDLDGYFIVDGRGRKDPLAGNLPAGKSITFIMRNVRLTNRAGSITIQNAKGEKLSAGKYTYKDIDAKTGEVKF